MNYLETKLAEFDEKFPQLDLRDSSGNKINPPVADLYHEKIKSFITSLFTEIVGENKKQLNAYAQFEADVMDGMKPELAQKELLKSLNLPTK